MSAHEALLAVHIAAGFVALGVAPIAMLVTKGGRIHRRFGKIYFWAMIVVAATALIGVAAFRAPPWLSMLAVFALYLVLSGYRVLFRKRANFQPSALDWGIGFFGFLIGLALVAWGGVGLVARNREPFSVVALALGVTAALLAGNEMRELASANRDRRAWWFRHMQSMLGAYVATVTAFSATNFRFLPTAIRWLWPLTIGVVGITAWVTYYKVRFQRGKPVLISEIESKIA